MPDTGPISTRLAELKRRWEEDPASPVFVQLAEELRKLGRCDEALEILAKGLERNPGYISAQVSIGRCLLDLGRGSDAQIALMEVLDRDPAHLVASKLLIEVHLLRGDGVLARRQLDQYQSLAPGDPDLEDLGRRIDHVLLAPADEEVEIVGWNPGAEPATPDASPLPTVAAALALAGDPFPGLHARLSRSHYRGRLAEEGLLGRGPVAPAVPAQPPEVTVAAAALSADPITTEPVPVSFLAQEPAPMLEEPPWQLEPVSLPLAEPAREAAWEASYEAEPSTDGAPTAEPTYEEALPSFLAPEPVAGEEPATVTLAQLYLRQGHAEEAGRIYLRVLDREPDNSAALAGLEEVARALTPEPVLEVPAVVEALEPPEPVLPQEPLFLAEPTQASEPERIVEVATAEPPGGLSEVPLFTTNLPKGSKAVFYRRFLDVVRATRNRDAS
jgi:tetratricopeptide (TPR) repeat protein